MELCAQAFLYTDREHRKYLNHLWVSIAKLVSLPYRQGRRLEAKLFGAIGKINGVLETQTENRSACMGPSLCPRKGGLLSEDRVHTVQEREGGKVEERAPSWLSLFLEVGKLKSGKVFSHPKLLKQMAQELLPLCFVLKFFLSKACTRYAQCIYSLRRK